MSYPRSLLLAAGLAGLTLLASGCGGSKAPLVASVGRTAVASASQAAAKHSGVLYASCMRAHGVPSFPDSAVTVNGGQVEFDLPRGLKEEPQFASASKECEPDLPNPSGTPAKHVNIQEELEFAACMRSHGITDFPDPLPGGGFDIPGDSNSPRFQAAQNACAAKQGSPGVHPNGP